MWEAIALRPSLILGALSVFLTIMSMGGASNCTTWSTSHPEIDTTPLGLWSYVDNDVCQPQCFFSIWYYEESNGIPGLQRGDEVVDDTCHGMIEADTILCALLPVGIMTPRAKKDRRAAGVALASAALLGATAFLPTAEAC